MERGYLDGGRADGALEQLHVINACRVGSLRGDVGPLVAVFVLELVEDDVASVGDSMREDDFGHLLHVRLPCGGVSRVVVAKRTILASGQPSRESSCIGFSVDVRTWTEDHVEAKVFGDFEQSFEVVGSGLEIQDAILR